MTYEYSNINQHDALYNSARDYPGGIEALAQRLGASANVLRNKLRPAIESHHVNFEEVSRIVELLEEARVPSAFVPLHAFCWRHGHVALRLHHGDVSSDELVQQILEVMGDEGRLATDLNSALADDRRIDRRELEVIEQDVERCVSGLMALLDRVRAKHKADFPGRE